MTGETWFLVKLNRPDLSETLSRGAIEGVLDYHGLGGDDWPLEALEDNQTAVELHRQYMARREHIEDPKDPGAWDFVCTDRAFAQRYHQAVARLLRPAQLLEVSYDLTRAGSWDGLDWGAPDGGYSIIPEEILTAGNPAVRWVNHVGLFPDEAAMEGHIATRDAERGENLDLYRAVAIRRLA